MGRKKCKHDNSKLMPFRTLEEDILLALRIGIPMPLIADLFNTSFSYVRSLAAKRRDKIPKVRRNILWELIQKEEPTYDPELEMQRGGSWNGAYPWQLRPGDFYED